tara:strand:+ start:476 stop:1264 length:789 start_codon:yes stop_codon:yes gene_type:complete
VKQSFSLKNIFKNEAQKNFSKNSVIKLDNLINKDICHKACQYVQDNEEKIIESYKNDKKGLTIDIVNQKKYIKYFEYPLKENAALFGKFVTSDIFKIAEYLLGDVVFLKSVELHSRCAQGTLIPPHQDNAYYGLKNAKGLTFYIPINKELADMGGLRYYKNPNTLEVDHIPSDSSGFSLRVSDLNNINFDTFDPNYKAGDCTIHHARSIHFADHVPINAERSLVVRLSLYSLNEEVKKGHSEWYKDMIKRNRNKFSDSLNSQ